MEAENKFLSGSCFLCAAHTNSLVCKACAKDIFYFENKRCPACANPSETNKPCGYCLKQNNFITCTRVLCEYKYPVDRLIQEIKFNKRPELVNYFADRFVSTIRNVTPLPQILIPVPLHPIRQKERGFNQSARLASIISRQMGLSVNQRLFVRKRHTEPQSLLSTQKRRKNVENAFHLKQPPKTERIAIIDDVITTGATVNELARLLKKAGVEHIETWAIAKAHQQ